MGSRPGPLRELPNIKGLVPVWFHSYFSQLILISSSLNSTSPVTSSAFLPAPPQTHWRRTFCLWPCKPQPVLPSAGRHPRVQSAFGTGRRPHRRRRSCRPPPKSANRTRDDDNFTFDIFHILEIAWVRMKSRNEKPLQSANHAKHASGSHSTFSSRK